MPLYEYVCPDCASKFEELRPSSRMDDPVNCPQGHPAGRRVLSVFAAMRRGSGNDTVPVAGGGCGGGCSNCACSLN